MVAPQRLFDARVGRHLTVSNMTADDRGWFARGYTWEPDMQLTATVQCMTPPGGLGGHWCTGCAVGGTVKFD